MPFGRLLSCRDTLAPLAWWEQAFGRDFPAVRPFLIPCTGKRADFYPCPDDPAVQLMVRESGEKYRAVPTGENADDFDDLELNWEDVQAHRFNPQAFIDFVRVGFGVKKRLFQPLENLHLVGHCPTGERTVYASFETDFARNIAIASGLHGPETAGCIIFPERIDHVEPLLQGKGIASVFLDEACSSTSSGCPQYCRKLQKDITNLELKQHMDARMDSVGREFADLEAENERLKGDLAKMIANIASQVDPEYFKWIYTILALGSVSKASAALKIPNSTFSKALKDGTGKGKMYRTLYSMIAPRKGCGQKSIEGYNPEFAEHQGMAYDNPDVIKDLLSGLEALNAKNWQQVRDELIELIQEELV